MDKHKKIVPASYGKAFDWGEFVGIESMSITYNQAADCNSDRDDDQHLTIETQLADSPGLDDAKKKQSYYFNIKTDKWSVDNPWEIEHLIRDFMSRIYTNTDEEIEELEKREEEIKLQYGNKD